jgi:hypothetical protein
MALLAPEDILQALGDLDPSENPFLYINGVLRDAFKQKANHAVTTVLSICVQNLRLKYRKGDWTLVRKISTVWGNFYM